VSREIDSKEISKQFKWLWRKMKQGRSRVWRF
jgi:hypothetical protein